MAVVEFLAIEGSYGAGLPTVTVHHIEVLFHPQPVSHFGRDRIFPDQLALLKRGAERICNEFLELKTAGRSSGLDCAKKGIWKIDGCPHGVRLCFYAFTSTLEIQKEQLLEETTRIFAWFLSKIHHQSDHLAVCREID